MSTPERPSREERAIAALTARVLRAMEPTPEYLAGHAVLREQMRWYMPHTMYAMEGPFDMTKYGCFDPPPHPCSLTHPCATCDAFRKLRAEHVKTESSRGR